MISLINNEMTNEQWLEIKSKGIGGSEIAAIMGLNPYQSPIDVYIAKTEGKKIEPNLIMRCGNVLEPFVAELYEEETGNKIIMPDKKIYIDDDYNFLLGSPDRFFEKEKNIGVLECKTTSVNYTELPQMWVLQLMWYMGIIGKEFGAVAMLRNNREFAYQEFAFVEDMFDLMKETAINFWKNNVEKRIPPEVDEPNKKELLKLYKKHTEGKYLQADSSVKDEIKLLTELKYFEGKVKAKIDELQSELKLRMQDSELIKDEYNNILLTWRKDKDAETFDSKAFQKDYPDLYKKYLKVKEGARKFLLKAKVNEMKLNDSELIKLLN